MPFHTFAGAYACVLTFRVSSGCLRDDGVPGGGGAFADFGPSSPVMASKHAKRLDVTYRAHVPHPTHRATHVKTQGSLLDIIITKITAHDKGQTFTR